MSRRRRTRVIQKAQMGAPPKVGAAATFNADQVAALLAAKPVNVTPAKPLPREPMVPFGPGMPLIPAPIDPVREDTGRAEPRVYQYRTSINLPGMTDRLIPWQVLRDAAETPLVRDCIRIRKNQISTLKWDIAITERALQQYRKDDPDTSSVVIQKQLRKELDPQVGRLTEFWEEPDVQQGYSFTEWASALIEEHLVLDALAIYPYKDRAGNPGKGLRILDGSTIKPLLNGFGRRPAPPHPAYQQILWGFPRGEYIADVDNEGTVLNPYDSDRLIYARREVRTFTMYGFSAVEQSLQDVDLYLRRMEWDKAQFTDGTQPAGWIKNTGLESWTPQQLMDYNRAFNDMYAGNTLERMRYHLLPPGMEPMESADIAEKYKPDYHLHLIKLVAMHFDTTISELGFTEAKGLGSAGYHEGQENVQERKATNPTLRWLQGILTQISRKHLGMPPELEFKFLGLDAEDEAAADDVIEKQMTSGRITRNEAREEMGRPPLDFEEADMVVVQTARGVVFLEGASKLAPPGEEVTPAQAPPLNDEEGVNDSGDAGNPGQGQQDGQQAPGKAGGAQTQGGAPAKAGAPAQGSQPAKDGSTTGVTAKKMELAAYRKWSRNGHGPARRQFAFKSLTPDDAALLELDVSKVTFRGKTAGGVNPKARPGHKHWPGWDQEDTSIGYWSGVLRTALTGAPTRVIAQRWLEVRRWTVTKATDPDTDARRRDALAWLTAVGFTLAPRIRRVLADLYVDAYVIGDRSAQVLLGDIEEVGLAGWSPGDTTATVRLITRDGVATSLPQLLDDAARVAGGMNNTRMQAMARVLGDSLGTDTSVDEVDSQLHDVLDDEASADMAVETEVARASTTAALDRYRISSKTTHYEWLTAGGGNVCVRCQENEAVGAIPIGQAFPNGEVPPAHPYCFPAGVVVAGPSVVATTTRRYEGDLVTIVFSDGQEVPVTPNHPVLTLDGWVAAGDLHKGAEVLRAGDVERVAALVCPDDRQVVARIEDVPGALSETFSVASGFVPVTAEDFHGDGSGDSQVEIVSAARDTQGDVVSPISEHASKVSFVFAKAASGVGTGDTGSTKVSLGGSSNGVVGGFEHGPALFLSGVLPAQCHRARPVPAVQSEVREHAVDDVSVDSVSRGEGFDRLASQEVFPEVSRCGCDTSGDSPCFCESSERDALSDQMLPEGLSTDPGDGCALAHRLSSFVQLDRVVELRRVNGWSGHVYNLETVGGWYFANGIIAHNCRCALLPVLSS